MLGDGQTPGLDVTVVVVFISQGNQLVQGWQGGHVGDRDHVALAEPPHLSLHPALLVSTFDAGRKKTRTRSGCAWR